MYFFSLSLHCTTQTTTQIISWRNKQSQRADVGHPTSLHTTCPETKTKTEVSQHSRAARRAASPSIDLDKSITSIKAPTDSVDYYPKNGAQDAGISKKKKQKPMSRTQRMRKEKGLERAEANSDILHTKTAKSFVRARRIDDRRVRGSLLTHDYKQFLTDRRRNGRFSTTRPSRASNQSPQKPQSLWTQETT